MTAPDPTVRLVPFTLADAERLIGWASEDAALEQAGEPDPAGTAEPGGTPKPDGTAEPGGSPASLMRWAGPIFHAPLDAAQIGTYLEPTAQEPPRRLVWRVDAAGDAAVGAAGAGDAAGSAPVGHIELDRIDRVERSAHLARVLVAPARRREGFGRAMIAAALGVAFDDLDLERVTLNVFDFNAAAIGCYESLGFTREALIRDARQVGDAHWTIIRYALRAADRRRRDDEQEGDHAI